MPVTEHHTIPEEDPKITTTSSSSSSTAASSSSSNSNDSSASNLTRTISSTNNKDEDDNVEDTDINDSNPDTFVQPSSILSGPPPPPPSSSTFTSPQYPSSHLLNKFNIQDYTEGSASPVSDIISIDNYYDQTTLINTTNSNTNTNTNTITDSSSSSYRFTQKASPSFTLSSTLYTNLTHHKLDYFHTFTPSSFATTSSYQSLSSSNSNIPKLLNTYLRPNAQFIGEQQSGKSRFHIKVEFKTVDLLNSTVTGFLQISGLTEDHSEIITCFKGEIINNPLNKYHWRNNHPKSNIHPDQIIRKYSFITENKQWGSYMKNDFEHWKKLINLNDLDDDLLMKRLIKIQNGEEDNQYIYMRWKEEFLLPDSRIKQISGASFDGFYYIVLNIGSNELFEIDANDNSSNSTSNTYNCMIPGSISGLYYHKTSEKFQSLSLRHIDDHGASGSFQFS